MTNPGQSIDDAERIGYLVTRANNGRLSKSSLMLSSSWWRRCKEHNRPYVVVVNLTGRKWATVKMELWHDLTKDQQDRLTHVLEAAALTSITKCLAPEAGDIAEALLNMGATERTKA